MPNQDAEPPVPAIFRPRWDQATVFIVPMTSQYRSEQKTIITANFFKFRNFVSTYS